MHYLRTIALAALALVCSIQAVPIPPTGVQVTNQLNKRCFYVGTFFKLYAFIRSIFPRPVDIAPPHDVTSNRGERCPLNRSPIYLGSIDCNAASDSTDIPFAPVPTATATV